MLLAERLLLLLLDVRTGTVRTHRGTDVPTLCAAALLIELAAQRRLAMVAGLLRSEADLPAPDPLLDETRRQLVRNPLKPGAAIAAVERQTAPLLSRLLERLHRRDLLHRERDWRFWRGSRYPLRSHQARNEVIAHLRQAAADAAPPAEALGLLLLADLAGILPNFLAAAHYERATAALLHLDRGAESDAARTVLAQLRRTLLDG